MHYLEHSEHMALTLEWLYGEELRQADWLWDHDDHLKVHCSLCSQVCHVGIHSRLLLPDRMFLKEARNVDFGKNLIFKWWLNYFLEKKCCEGQTKLQTQAKCSPCETVPDLRWSQLIFLEWSPTTLLLTNSTLPPLCLTAPCLCLCHTYPIRVPLLLFHLAFHPSRSCFVACTTSHSS
jgi:hypothetical protein